MEELRKKIINTSYVLVGFVIFAGGVIYLKATAQQDYMKMQSETTKVVIVKNELQNKVLQLEEQNKQKDEELAKLKQEVKDLSTVQRIQKDVARIFDGRKD